MPNLNLSDFFRSLQPMKPALAFGAADAGASTNRADDQPNRGGTTLFASGQGGGSGRDDDYDEYDEAGYDEPVQETRRNPGAAPRGGGSGTGGGGGGGRQRTIQFQPEERYWTEYLRIALPIIGLLLMIGLFWYWASQLTDDNDPDEPVGTQQPGTTEIMTPASTPQPTQPPVVQPTSPPASTPQEPAEEEPPAEEETPEGEATEPAAEGTGDFAEGDYVVVNEDTVNMRADATTSAEIVATLDSGTVLLIEGGPEEADDYTWYQVTVEETGDSGWIAVDFLDPAPEE